MRKMYIILLLLMAYHRVQAQTDAHFSQYYAYPLWLNPAFTGMIDGNARVTMNYRRQLPGLDVPLTTQAITADFSLPKGLGMGVTILTQGAPDAGYRYTTGYLSVSYRAHLSQYSMLSTGFQLGLLNRKMDPSKFQFGNQFNPVSGYDPGIPSGEMFTYSSATSLDASVGLLYFDGNPSRKWNPFIGASLYHPNQPDNHFLAGNEKQTIPVRYSIHGGTRIQLGQKISIVPHILFLKQGNASELAAGMVCNLNIEPGKDLMLGGMYRKDDAVIPALGLHLNGFTIGFSYDVNTSGMKTVSSSNGGYELSLSITSRRRIPDTKFICPRF